MTTDNPSSRKKKSVKHSTPADPYRHLAVGNSVLLSRSFVDPVHWWLGSVHWIADDRSQILVHQGGIAGTDPHFHLHDMDYVRAFGTTEHCNDLKHQAMTTVREAARQVHQITDLSRDLQRRLQEVFETLAADALKHCGVD